MEKLSIQAENLPFLSHRNPRPPSSVFHSSFEPRRLCLFPPTDRSRVRVFCSVKETQKVVGESQRVDGVLKGIKVSGSEVEFGAENRSSEEVEFTWNWPPWKNLPERYKLIGTTSLAFVICNMDKVNLSIAIIPMSHQFGWSSSVAGLVQSSFFWGYALSQLPGGWLAKIFGGRKVLKIGVLIWSLATALVPVLAGFMPGLILSRILEWEKGFLHLLQPT